MLGKAFNFFYHECITHGYWLSQVEYVCNLKFVWL